MQLDVESLRTLITVLDHGSMTRAAEHLDLSQSAVSWKIKRLEDRVRRPLLIRDGRNLRPTRDARALLDDARQIVEIHDRAAARFSTTELRGTVKLGANEEVDASRMASLLGQFHRTHPGATIEFLIDHTEILMRDVEQAKVDVAVVQVDDDHLRSTDTVLWSSPLRWVTSAEWSFDPNETVPLITFGEHCFYRAISTPILGSAGIDHVVAFSGSSINGVRSAVAAGLGVGVLGEHYLDDAVVPWAPGDDLAPLPTVHQIIRTVPGDTRDIADALVDAIASALLEPVLDPLFEPTAV